MSGPMGDRPVAPTGGQAPVGKGHEGRINSNEGEGCEEGGKIGDHHAVPLAPSVVL